jgi:hypothetical protein
MKDKYACLWFMIAFTFVAIVFVVVGIGIGKHTIHKEAVKQGLAHWTLNDGGHVEFKWNNQ